MLRSWVVTWIADEIEWGKAFEHGALSETIRVEKCCFIVKLCWFTNEKGVFLRYWVIDSVWGCVAVGSEQLFI